jgi:hypothetical protein
MDPMTTPPLHRRLWHALLVTVIVGGGIGLTEPARASAQRGTTSAASRVDVAFVRWVFEGREAFYQLGILPDGFPGRWADGKLIAHPLYGTYVLRAYVENYEARPGPGLLAGMAAFAKVAMARMTTLDDALVMNNPKPLGFIRSPGLRYSGLTMAYYAHRLAQIGQLTGDAEIISAAERSFRSLLIPEADGGVLYRWGGEVALAEAPGDPADLTLNGWLSILTSLHGYADVTGSTEARTLFDESVRTLGRLLPLYDARDLHLSRYALSGPVKVRLVFSDPTGVRLEALHVVIPGSGSYPLAVAGATQWVNAVAARDVRVATAASGVRQVEPRGPRVGLNLVLTRLTYPEPNEIRLTVASPHAVSVSIEIRSGRFDPRSWSEVGQTWHRVATTSVHTGRHAISLPIPWALGESVAPLTNWAHVIDGKRVNIYHAIHVRRLEELHRITGLRVLAEFAARWRADMCAWASIPAYAGLYVTADDGAIVLPEALCQPAVRQVDPRLRLNRGSGRGSLP